MRLDLIKTVLPWLAVILLLWLVSCGKKSSPVPPVVIAPKPAGSFMVVPRSEAIIAVWMPPRENTNDTPLIDLGGFRIYKAEAPFDKFCDACPRNFFLRYDAAYTGIRGIQPERKIHFYMDTDRTPGTVLSYKIRCYNEKTTVGPPTPVIDIAWDTPFMEPAGLTEERRHRVVVLTWTPPELLEDGTPPGDTEEIFYNLYRTRTKGVYEDLPLNRQLLSEPVFKDVPERIDSTYHYQVRAVRMVMDTPVESRPSNELTVDYFDLTPPGKPHGLTAIPQPEGVFLKWIPKVERGIAGYNVYRKQAGEKAFLKINIDLITDKNDWLDTTAVSGRRYFYAVTAVDTSAMANESDFSDRVEVTHLH